MTGTVIAGDESAERSWRFAAALLLAVAILLRISLYFPLAAFPADSDGAVTGLCGLQVLDGQLLVFSPDGTRHSAVRCYVSGFYFALLGPGRSGLALTGLTFEVIYLAFMYLFLRRLLDARGAAIAMAFVAVPPAQYLIASYVPWGYGEVMAACAAVLYFAARWRDAPHPLIIFSFGLTVGLGLWLSLQSIMISLPAILWIAWKRGRSLLVESRLALIGAVIGFSPWLLFNLLNGFPSLTQNFAARPAGGAAQVFDNILYLLAYNLPMLLTNSSSHSWGVSTLALVLSYGLVAIGIALALCGRTTIRLAPREDLRSAVMLGLCVIVFALVICVLSQPGSIRGWTVRYIMPLYLACPFLIAIGLSALSREDFWLAVLPAVAILGINLSAYSLPGTARRAELTAELAQHERLRQRLSEWNLDAVIGDFWLVYHLNFDSGRTLPAVPFQHHSDYFGVAESLPPRGLRWAMVSRSADDLARRAKRAAVNGGITTFETMRIFLPDPPQSEISTQQLLDEVRGAN